MWEVFHEDGSAPLPDFQAYDSAANNACKVKPQFGDLVLASFSGIDDIGQAGAGELAGPLAAQNGRYVRYQTLYNQTAFDFIVRNRYYLRSNLPKVPSPRPTTPVMEFPVGSVVLKAAWLDMAGFPAEQVKRYYTRSAIVRDREREPARPSRSGWWACTLCRRRPAARSGSGLPSSRSIACRPRALAIP